ncbi:MAG TPA: MotA/TolQ/ExbB proton channel family protein [Chthoniobacterales bacterium]|nr:MotA/TolQ/ExbB proton channel family protein [Chthoniobacterales bacterium]
MKTFLSLCLSVIALTAFAQPPQKPGQQPPPPNAPPAAGAPMNPTAGAQPGAPAQPPPGMPAQQPGAPGQPPPGGMPPGAPGVQPGAPGTAAAPGVPAPGTSVTATLSASPSASAAAPSAHLYEMKTTGNFFIDKFNAGGPVMWPILIVSIVALTVVIERALWWGGRWFRRDPKRVEKVFTAVEVGDVAEASRLSRDSRDPVLRMIWNGLNHQHASLQGALQVAAGIEIKRAGRFLVVMDTLVTLAPLLGLLGTVTGLMKAFLALGNEEIAIASITGGIGEALIATACGLGIAIFALIPFNFFTSRVSNLEFELQTAATNLEVMLEAQGKVRHEEVNIGGRAPQSSAKGSSI